MVGRGREVGSERVQTSGPPNRSLISTMGNIVILEADQVILSLFSFLE